MKKDKRFWDKKSEIDGYPKDINLGIGLEMKLSWEVKEDVNGEWLYCVWLGFDFPGWDYKDPWRWEIKQSKKVGQEIIRGVKEVEAKNNPTNQK